MAVETFSLSAPEAELTTVGVTLLDRNRDVVVARTQMDAEGEVAPNLYEIEVDVPAGFDGYLRGDDGDADAFNTFDENYIGSRLFVIEYSAPAGGGTGRDPSDWPEIKGKIRVLGSARIEHHSPVLATDKIELVRGDTYAAADGSALEWSVSNTLNLAGARARFPIGAPVRLQQDGTIITNPGEGDEEDTYTLRFELSREQTAALAVGTQTPFDVQLTLNSGHRVTPIKGTCRVVADITR